MGYPSGYGAKTHSGLMPNEPFTSGGLGGGAQLDAPDSQVSAELNRLVSSVAELESAISALDARLAPVIMPQPPSPTGAGEQANKAPRCQVADVIAGSAERVRTQVAKIGYLINAIGI